MSSLREQKMMSLARHLAGGTSFAALAGANLSIVDFFTSMTMDRLMGLIAFIATIYIAINSKNAEQLAPYQPPAPPRKPDGTPEGA